MSSSGYIATAILLVILLLVLITLTNIIIRLYSNASLPPTLPWAGTKEQGGPYARVQANFYSKTNQIYVLPYYINGPQVILPNSQIRWLIEQPDSVLSQEKVNRQFLEAEYAFFHANLVDAPVHPEIIQHQLTKKLKTFVNDVVDEASSCLEDIWGTDTEQWREVKVYDTMLTLLARLSIRVFMGLPLCRNQAFLKICSQFIRKVALAAAAIGLFPGFLKPVVGPIFTLYDRLLYYRCSRYLKPIIHERLERLRNPSPHDKSASPNDYIQWAIGHALTKPTINPLELDPRVIACRFSVLAFAAIQSSVITLTNTLFDIASSPECTTSIAYMRKEVAQETTSGDTWSKASIARMTHVDSALRESLRLNGFIERGIMKMVVALEGVTLPDGSHIPCGTKVGVSGYSIHHDEDIYPDANKYNAFRFARSSPGDAKKKGPQKLVSTSETFLGFSHGSHSCPGRFFATNQLKIALGHIAFLYDIEPIPKRPANQWFFGHIAPPMSATLRVRRRKP
ncbi:cytochrome P450 [Hypoxylon trugodes]|uniref:cytochrome P450 n=1 Tax=Hypoxylon trugodes TaxID=326681 RepID=UPI0021948055|nr:cytochrome P450 [Hypoxylon trugodes]KAI1385636.1 cytochrome P450 [Hypoxylon trugodes]